MGDIKLVYNLKTKYNLGDIVLFNFQKHTEIGVISELGYNNKIKETCYIIKLDINDGEEGNDYAYNILESDIQKSISSEEIDAIIQSSSKISQVIKEYTININIYPDKKEDNNEEK